MNHNQSNNTNHCLLHSVLKRSAIVLVLLWMTVSSAFSQVDETRNYVYFFSDSVLYGRIVELRSPMFGGSFLMCDSIKVSKDFVKFFKGETGFYANTININSSGTSTFCQRIRKGKINLYERDVTSYSPGFYSPGFGGPGMYSSGMVTRNIKNYYNIGFGDLKKAKYKNLLVDLSDNPESMMHLTKYKSVRKTETILGVVGGVAVATGLVAVIATTNHNNGLSKSNTTPGVVTMLAGAGCMWVSYFYSLSKPKHLRQAIDAYNK
ncbi:MAG TPA: hypothetical protein VK179_13985 [Bacteroidales bacterium]|nr:hypothetical protein [Bacteroidales bacterium]